ncbi:MAG TPA: DUF4118 domain-containing protein, partial [Anaerolineaceae bacterium]|nr:DUF4118 domain-containing protein [Anaerolineaceae bacterium]
HPRRYQDIEELINSGIDVYTTVNIQNLESLKDIVTRITGITYPETIPDRLLDEASEIQLIDLSPEELLKRMGSENTNGLLRESLHPNQLAALRELALRRAALRVDNQARGYALRGAWTGSERLMVCISAHPRSQSLVRAGYRLAQELKAEWHVVYAETPSDKPLSDFQQANLGRTMELAETLGAKTHTVIGENIAESLVQFATQRQITKIILGKPLKQHNFIQWRLSVLEQLLRHNLSLDIHIANTDDETFPRPVQSLFRPQFSLWRYLQATVMVGVITLLGFPLQNIVHPTNLVMLYLATVVFAAIYLGRGPSLWTSIISVATFDFFYVEPKYSLTVEDTEYLITFAVFLGVAWIISNLAGIVSEQVRSSQQRAAQTAALNSLSRDLTVAMSMEEMLQAVIIHISQTFSREVLVMMPENGQLRIKASSQEFTITAKDQQVSAWAYEHSQSAGRGTQTHPDCAIRFEPLRTARGIVGVLGVKPQASGPMLSSTQRQMLESFASLAALGIERVQLNQQANQAQVLSATDRLQTALLNSISHDLRTPLVSIQGVLESMLEMEQNQGNNQSGLQLDRAARMDMLENAHEETLRLNRLVENLLDMTRLEAGALKVILDQGDIQDVIGSALNHLAGFIANRNVEVLIAPDLPLVPMDFVLIEQVLINLLDNALKYSSPALPLEIGALQQGKEILVKIADRGPGIPAEDLERIFNKFYRVSRSGGIKGTGLGLSICKGIIEAHNGRIWALNREGGGAVFSFTLPIQPVEKGNSNE